MSNYRKIKGERWLLWSLHKLIPFLSHSFCTTLLLSEAEEKYDTYRRRKFDLADQWIARFCLQSQLPSVARNLVSK